MRVIVVLLPILLGILSFSPIASSEPLRLWTCADHPEGVVEGSTETEACTKVYEANCQVQSPMNPLFTDEIPNTWIDICQLGNHSYPIASNSKLHVCPAAKGLGLEEFDVIVPSTTARNSCSCSNPDAIAHFGEHRVGCEIPNYINKNPTSCGRGGSSGTNQGVSKNPCDFRTGAKYRHETDFSDGVFTFTRNYHSLNLVDIGFGIGWHNQFLKRLEVLDAELSVVEGSGRGEPWRLENGVWTGDEDSDYLIIESATGYTVTLQRGDVHEYDLSGKLLTETDPSGKVMNYVYDSEGRLISVTNHYQQSISFSYSTDGKDHVVKMVDTTGAEYAYEYDANDNLIAVVYPDVDTDSSNNPKRIYHYEDSNFPNHLTGITNANGERYATFSYDTDGRAIESALAPTTNSVGQERIQLNFQGAN